MLHVVFVLVGLVLALVVYAATRPNEMRIERAIEIDRSPDRVFALVNDFREWKAWSPWEELDPSMKRSYEGAERGKGAVYTWDGNDKAGAGRMEIVASEVPSRIQIALAFTRPFASSNKTTFAVTPTEKGARITWTMEAPRPFMMKLLGVVLNLDKAIGNDFERGLAKMKATAER